MLTPSTPATNIESNLNIGQCVKFSNTTPATFFFFSASPHILNSPKQIINWRLNIQMSDSLGTFLIQATKTPKLADTFEELVSMPLD